MFFKSEADLTTVVNLLRTVPGLPHIVRFIRRQRANIIDQRLNIHTVPPPDRGQPLELSTSFADATEYEVVDYILLRRYMDPVWVGPDDVLIDIGCGMGRVLCVFVRKRLRKCIGIEVSRELAIIAKRNAHSLCDRRTPIEIRIGDAAEADYSEGTIFWIYNPFWPRDHARCALAAWSISV